MNRSEYFAFLMDVIDEWVDEEPGEYVGPFRYLREGTSLKGIAVTPNCSIHKAQLKTYLATEVLGIYRWNTKSKVSYRDIQKTLAGEASKKYVFHFETLEDCMSREANQEAARKSCFRKDCWEWVEVPEGRVITLYLLERLQKAARIKLGEYWRMCAADYDISSVKIGKRMKWKPKKKKDWKDLPEEKLPEEELMEQKQNKYMECLMAVALHEIFTREYVQSMKSQEAKADENRSKVRLLREELAVFPEKLKEKAAIKDDMGMAALKERNQQMVSEALECLEFLKVHMVDVGVRMEHVVGMITELQLVMFLETKNLEMIQSDQGMGQYLTRYLKCLEDRDIDGFVRYDKNRKKYYQIFREDMKDIFFRYMENTSRPNREEIAEAMELYFCTVEKMKWYGNNEDEEKQREKMKKLWNAQVVLNKPIWCSYR